MRLFIIRFFILLGLFFPALASAVDISYPGNYSGTFSGDDSGTWTATISSTGAITGKGVSSQDGLFTVVGQGLPNGSLSMATTGSVSTGATFIGSINLATRTISGTWVNTFYNQRGTWVDTVVVSAADLLPSIRINGSNSDMTIDQSDNISLSIELNSGSYTGRDADWWLMASTPFGWYYYNYDEVNSSLSSWQPGSSVSYRGPLFNLSPFEVLNGAGLPKGDYAIYFGVDMDKTGQFFDPAHPNFDIMELNVTSKDLNGECKNIAGRWLASESITYTCVLGGDSFTDSDSGSGTVDILQNGCNVSYVPPTINAPRTGQITGNQINLSGAFAIPLDAGVSLSQNSATLTGTVNDEKKPFTLNGTGLATGTAYGIPFSCTGYSTAKFKQCYDVAVALLEGGPIPIPLLSVPGTDLNPLKEQAEFDPRVAEIDPRVIAKVFPPRPSQLSKVQEWLDEINEGCDDQAKVILVGYSFGGNAVRNSNFKKMCSRIAIDPIDPASIYDPNDPFKLHFDQRHLTLIPEPSEARFINRLASTKEELEGRKSGGLFGYNIYLPDDEKIVDPSNHFTIIDRVLEEGLVRREVEECLR